MGTDTDALRKHNHVHIHVQVHVHVHEHVHMCTLHVIACTCTLKCVYNNQENGTLEDDLRTQVFEERLLQETLYMHTCS